MRWCKLPLHFRLRRARRYCRLRPREVSLRFAPPNINRLQTKLFLGKLFNGVWLRLSGQSPTPRMIAPKIRFKNISASPHPKQTQLMRIAVPKSSAPPNHTKSGTRTVVDQGPKGCRKTIRKNDQRGTILDLTGKRPEEGSGETSGKTTDLGLGSCARKG